MITITCLILWIPGGTRYVPAGPPTTRTGSSGWATAEHAATNPPTRIAAAASRSDLLVLRFWRLTGTSPGTGQTSQSLTWHSIVPGQHHSWPSTTNGMIPAAMHLLGLGHTGTCALTRHGPSGRYASLYFRLETVIGASCPAWVVDRKQAPDGRHGLDGKYIVDGRHAVAGRYGGAGRHTGGTLTGLAADVEQSSRQPEPSRVLSWGSRHLADIVTIASYLLGALFVTAHLWVNPVFRRQVGDHQDVDQAAWFMRYAATAIQHFRLPALTATAMNAPHGVNMMWNTSMLLPGSLMTPITLLFGPQVSLTVLLVIGFAGSAASMYYVLRHWQSSTIAAALGGAVYGLSPALVNSGIGHYSL